MDRIIDCMVETRGAHPPLREMMHSPLFQNSPFPTNFLTLWKISQILPFPQKFSNFHSPKFFLFTNHKFRIPLYSLFQYVSPLFQKNYSYPLLFKIAPFFLQIYVSFTYFMCFFVSPYFYHDAFMHHTMHVLDAPG